MSRFELGVVALVVLAWLPGLAILARGVERVGVRDPRLSRAARGPLGGDGPPGRDGRAPGATAAIWGRILLVPCLLAYLAALVVRQASLLGVVFVATAVVRRARAAGAAAGFRCCGFRSPTSSS